MVLFLSSLISKGVLKYPTCYFWFINDFSCDVGGAAEDELPDELEVSWELIESSFLTFYEIRRTQLTMEFQHSSYLRLYVSRDDGLDVEEPSPYLGRVSRVDPHFESPFAW